LFGHTPRWMKAVADHPQCHLPGGCGLGGADGCRKILTPTMRASYRVGDKIGPWPIFFINDNEIVAGGRNNKHLDFRLSVLRLMDGNAESVVVSTICSVHNLAGKIYLFFIVPFHRSGVQSLLANAVAAKRL
jgi:hypothetical protein